jgi:hypothetical protein
MTTPEQPRRSLPPANLAESFGTRTSGLQGLRKTAQPTPPPGADDQPPPAAPERPRGAPTAAEPAAPRPTRPPRASDASTGATVAVTVYVPPDLRDQVARERQRALLDGEPATNASVVLAAVEAVAGRLDELVAVDDVDVVDQVGAGGLFQYRPRRPGGEPVAQLGFRLPAHDRDTLDQLADAHTHGDKSRLVTLALRDRYAR